jgi:uncharacterized protein (TIGR02001 family)
MNLSKLIKIFLLLIPFNVLSQGEIALSLNSDSIWRGITQNNGNPSIGADFDFNLENGFYSGFWIENCCSETKSYPNKEIGYRTGFSQIVKENLIISIEYLGTNYPNSKKDNFDEIKLDLFFYNFLISYSAGLDSFPDYYEISYKYNPISNGSNIDFGVELNANDFSFEISYFYFDSNMNSNLNNDGLVFSITKNTFF